MVARRSTNRRSLDECERKILTCFRTSLTALRGVKNFQDLIGYLVGPTLGPLQCTQDPGDLVGGSLFDQHGDETILKPLLPQGKLDVVAHHARLHGGWRDKYDE